MKFKILMFTPEMILAFGVHKNLNLIQIQSNQTQLNLNFHYKP